VKPLNVNIRELFGHRHHFNK